MSKSPVALSPTIEEELHERIEELEQEVKDAFYDGRDARERAEKAEAQLYAVRPYLQHTNECHEYGVPATEKTIGCTCGLQQALRE